MPADDVGPREHVVVTPVTVMSLVIWSLPTMTPSAPT
jgi:hypothetical protein